MTTENPHASGAAPQPPTSYDAKDLAEGMAIEVLDHIDSMYPGMWNGMPKSCRQSIRNKIINQCEMRLKKFAAPQSPTANSSVAIGSVLLPALAAPATGKLRRWANIGPTGLMQE